ncbi:MAG: PAS domain-containing protein, partial [Verrucomicrobiota bacterium]
MSTSLEFLADDFDEILRLAPDAIIVHDMKSCVHYWNAAAEEMYGWTSEEIKGYPIDKICYLDAKEREFAMAKIRDYGTWEGELRQIDRKGDEHLVRCRQRLIRNQSGDPLGVISFNTDITESRKLEDAEKRAHHIRSSSLLAGGIAHDL